MKKEKLVILGGGMAAIACLEEIVRLDRARFEITVLSKEKGLPYNRVLLSSILKGEKPLNDILLHDAGWFEEKGVNLHTNFTATEINRQNRAITAEDGVSIKYDKLILSTGSLPIIPNIKGTDKEGVLSFRNTGDCEKIKKSIEKYGNKAVVIGGGLLGLEVAHGLLSIGCAVTIVHLMDMLMERQIDGQTSALLKEDLEKLGMKILLKKETVEIFGNGKVEGIGFKDGEKIAADLVIMSIGIKPNADLAKKSGIYCERGVVVSDTMQTFDPAVYAIGECVEHRKLTFGLVSPIFEQARVLANHLAGDSRLMFKTKPISARLKVPGIELYSAGTVTDTDGVETIEYLDKVGKIYKRIFLRESKIRGIILYGDTSLSPRLFSSLIDEEDISGKRKFLLSQGAFGSQQSLIAEMPLNAIVCGCNGVTKGTIIDAIVKKGLFTREDVKRETKASSSCGGCGALVDEILESTLGASFEKRTDALCGCTKYSKEDCIKNIKEKRLTTVAGVMEALGWETVGCEECRPALNYYVGMIWPKEATDDPTSRLVGERVHANIQKDSTFSVIPRIYGGVVTADELKKIADVAEKYEAPLIKLTGGQRIGLFGIKREDLPKIWKDLDMPSGYAYGKALRTVKTCVGLPFCRYGTQDSMNLGIELEKLFEGLWTPAKVKMGVSACPRNCAESEVKDIGIVGIVGGFEIFAGGCAGIELKGGELFTTVKTNEEVIETVGAILQYYREDANYAERLFKWMRRKTIGEVKKKILEHAENRTLLFKRLNEAISVRIDPWKERLKNEFANS